MTHTNINRQNYWFSRTSSSQTMKNWPVRIEDFHQVPNEFKPVFLGQRGLFPYCVYIPSDRVLKNFRLTSTGSTLLVLYEDRIEIFAARPDSSENNGETEKRIEKTVHFLGTIVQLEVGEILLYSWLTIYSPEKKSRVNFNTVRNTLFEPFIQKVRNFHKKVTIDEIYDTRRNEGRFDFLQSIDYKYMNLAKASIRKHDTVKEVVYQHDHTVQSIGVGKVEFFKKFICSHITMETDSELILLNEDLPVKNNYDNRYGGIFNYIPLTAIQKIEWPEAEYEKTGKVEITLKDGRRIKRLYTLNNKKFEDLFLNVRNE